MAEVTFSRYNAADYLRTEEDSQVYLIWKQHSKTGMISWWATLIERLQNILQA